MTRYDPEQGVLDVDIALPVQMKDLQTKPQVDQYITAVQDIVSDFVPSSQTLSEVYDKASIHFIKEILI